MARELTNREYVVEMLNKGRALYRITSKGTIIKYTYSRFGVCRTMVNSKARGKYMSFGSAVAQLTRNFKEIN